MDGILNINKAAGMTSFKVVALVKQLTKERRVGHGGTLDPAATGVLPVCLGKATRIIEYLVDTSKTYQAKIELGVATDTFDATGKVTQQGDISRVTREQVEVTLASFRGSIQQTPPMYSAVKYHGKPLYHWARAGITVKRKSRITKIYQLELKDWQPPIASIEVVCSKGTYIRSLAHDLGQALGCGASLKGLIRLKCGVFDIKDAIPVTQLEDAVRGGCWQCLLYPIDIVLSHLTAVVVSDDALQAIRNGRPIIPEKPDSFRVKTTAWSPNEERCRVYTVDGQFVGVLRLDTKTGQWQPEKVFL